MNTQPVRIIDVGHGPQIEGHRLTVMDVFYYVHRGYDYEVIKTVMLTLKQEEYEAAMEYIREHYTELAVKDARVEERIRRDIEEQKKKGLYHEIDTSIPQDVRLARLKERLLEKKRAENKVAESDLVAR